MSDHVSRETDCFPNQNNDQLAERIQRQLAAKAAGGRKIIRHAGTLCCRCHQRPPAKKDRYCAECRKSYNADWRLKIKNLNRRNASIANVVLAAVSATENTELSKGKNDGQDAGS